MNLPEEGLQTLEKEQICSPHPFHVRATYTASFPSNSRSIWDPDARGTLENSDSDSDQAWLRLGACLGHCGVSQEMATLLATFFEGFMLWNLVSTIGEIEEPPNVVQRHGDTMAFFHASIVYGVTQLIRRS